MPLMWSLLSRLSNQMFISMWDCECVCKMVNFHDKTHSKIQIIGAYIFKTPLLTYQIWQSYNPENFYNKSFKQAIGLLLKANYVQTRKQAPMQNKSLPFNYKKKVMNKYRQTHKTSYSGTFTHVLHESFLNVKSINHFWQQTSEIMFS
jgi:hypothetical protein